MDDFAYSEEEPEVAEQTRPVVLAPTVSLPISTPHTPPVWRPNHLTGFVEQHSMDRFDFNNQFYTFENYKYAAHPSAQHRGEYVARAHIQPQPDLPTVYQKAPDVNRDFRQREKLARVRNDDPSSGDFLGPWAYYPSERGIQEAKMQEISEEQKQRLAQFEERRRRKVQEHKDNPEVLDYEQTDVVINEARVVRGDLPPDYQGRGLLEPPSEWKHSPTAPCYLPKQCTKTLAGHTKGVQCVRFFPNYGHVLLSCSLDHTVKLWDVHNSYKCLQTYLGHTNAVRDIVWSADGTQFLSCSYDRLIRQWDAETGTVLNTFSCRRIPYCMRYNPKDPNTFIVGTANKRINQYDTNSGKKVLIYDEHLGAVNAMCFVDDDKQFVSSSDDKKVFLWEFGIGVVMKHLNEPNMHALPYLALHPNARHFAAQSLDNSVLVFEACGGFRHNRRKKFKGHVNGGFACALSFSPDGEFLASGDSLGRTWLWEWKTTRNLRMLTAHPDNVCIGLDWHPLQPSRLATCGWDGVIKVWD